MGNKLFSCILAVALAVLMIPSASIAYAIEGTSDQPGDTESQQPAGEGEGEGGGIQPQSLASSLFETNCAYTLDEDKSLVIRKDNPNEAASFTVHDLQEAVGEDWTKIRSFRVSVNEGDSIAISGTMQDMFYACDDLETADLKGLDVSDVTDMSYLFDNCKNLTSVDLEGLNSSGVINMSSMFLVCKKLTNVNLKDMDTSGATNMSFMFNGCAVITTLDLSTFNTSNVTDMFEMFDACTNLANIDLSSFNTAQVTDMSSMFENCRALTSLDLSSFNTANVEDMDNMFKDCTNLETIYVSETGFNLGKVSSDSSMFLGSTKLKGGAGTTYDSSKTNRDGACIDTNINGTWGVDKGYFTLNQTFAVTASIGGGAFTGGPTATRGQAYTGTITPSTGHEYPASIQVKVGSAVLAETAYTYDAENGELEIPGAQIIDAITITAECTAAVYNVTGNIANGFLVGEEQVSYGQAYSAAVVPEPGYETPASITVTVAGTILTDGYSYSAQGGAIEIKADKITGPIIITGECAEQTYQVTPTITNGSFEGGALATYYQSYTATIRAAEHYVLPETITVTVIDRSLLEGEYKYNPETGALEILAGKVTGSINITAVCEPATYAVTNTIANGSFTGDAKVTYLQPYTATIAANEHYSLPASITVTVGGTELANGYTYDDQTGTIAIDGEKVTGDTSITAACVPQTFTVDLEQEGGTAPLASVVATYGSPMPTISGDNLPVREGYKFLGYWTEKNGQGTQYYHADGTSAHNWDKASSATLYANWTAHYGILEGAALTHQVGDGQACAVRINADIAKFLNVYVDGVLVDPANYDVTEGSTIVTYKQSYLDTLSAGVHSARYQFTDGYADSTITIAAAEKSAPDGSGSGSGSGSGAEIVKTGDSMTMMSWLALICFISTAIACFALYCRKTTSRGKRSR